MPSSPEPGRPEPAEPPCAPPRPTATTRSAPDSDSPHDSAPALDPALQPPKPVVVVRTPDPAPATGSVEAPRPDPARGYGPLFRVREFRAVFAAHLLSLLGVVVAEIALTVLVYRATGSPLMSALTFALGFLPYALGGTLLAGLADRLPARRVLVGCDLLCAGCAAAMVRPATPVAALLVLRCAMSFVAPLFQGARSASLADVLGPGEPFVLGRSLLRMVAQSAQLVGFGLGGLLLTVLAPRGALALTCAGFLASAAILRLGTRARPARAAGGRSVKAPSGARAVLGDRRLRALTLLCWLPPVFVIVPEALLTPYAAGIGAGTVTLGVLMCALPVGTVAGELWAGSALTARTRSRIVAPLARAAPLPLLVYLVRPGAGAVLVALLLVGLAHAYTLGLDRMYVDAVPEELRGRAMTLLTTGMMTAQGLGMVLAGLAAEFLPVHVVVAGAGVIGAGVAALLLAEVRATEPRAVGGGGRGRRRGSKDETGVVAK
ncbi:MFS transporter [Streptomyces sp. NPDC048606]|uniref:MFS transporter n=1 Tax=Streptomyces sp. NPDC048606 TaxID=3154726 RepID=UPI003413243C